MTKFIPGKLYKTKTKDMNGLPLGTVLLFLEKERTPWQEGKGEPLFSYKFLYGDKIVVKTLYPDFVHICFEAI